MRIAVATNRWGRGGGIYTQSRWLADGLQAAGHHVEVFQLANSASDSGSKRLLAPGTWHLPSLVRSSSEERFAVHHVGAVFPEWEFSRYRPRAELTAALEEFDVVHLVSGGPILARVVEHVSRPKILHVATTARWERPARLPSFSLARRVWGETMLRAISRREAEALKHVDQILVLNDAMLRWVLENSSRPVIKLTPGVDVERFQPVVPWDYRRPIVAFGRLGDGRKRWPLVVSAYEGLVSRYGVVNGLIVAGRGPVPVALSEQIARSPRRDRIQVWADVPDGRLPSLLAGGSVFLQLSAEEGLGIAGLEAMAAGLPVIATATSGTREYVRDGENGYLLRMEGDLLAQTQEAVGKVLVGTGAELAMEARRTVVERYSSSVQLAKIDRLGLQLSRKGMG